MYTFFIAALGACSVDDGQETTSAHTQDEQRFGPDCSPTLTTEDVNSGLVSVVLESIERVTAVHLIATDLPMEAAAAAICENTLSQADVAFSTEWDTQDVASADALPPIDLSPLDGLLGYVAATDSTGAVLGYVFVEIRSDSTREVITIPSWEE